MLPVRCRLVYGAPEFTPCAPQDTQDVQPNDLRPHAFCVKLAAFMLEVLHGPQHAASSSTLHEMAYRLGHP